MTYYDNGILKYYDGGFNCTGGIEIFSGFGPGSLIIKLPTSVFSNTTVLTYFKPQSKLSYTNSYNSDSTGGSSTVTLSKNTASVIAGFFSGIIALSGQTRTITNGSFRVNH